MKPFFSLLFAAVCLNVAAQDITTLNAPNRYAVMFNGTNDVELGQYFPVNIQLLTEASNPPAPAMLMTYAQITECQRTNYTAYSPVLNSRYLLAQRKQADDWADFVAKLDKLETWIDKTAGTNSLNNAQRDNAINDICKAFQKVKPILKDAYKAQQQAAP